MDDELIGETPSEYIERVGETPQLHDELIGETPLYYISRATNLTAKRHYIT